MKYLYLIPLVFNHAVLDVLKYPVYYGYSTTPDFGMGIGGDKDGGGKILPNLADWTNGNGYGQGQGWGTNSRYGNGQSQPYP